MSWVENVQQLFKESASSEQTLVSAELKLKGTLFFNGAGSVAGTITGSLKSLHHLTIEEGARISADCSVGNLHVSGQVDGDLCAKEHIRLSPGSKVRGSIRSKTLEITPRADFEGPLDIGGFKS